MSEMNLEILKSNDETKQRLLSLPNKISKKRKVKKVKMRGGKKKVKI
jgi:hypothetical protein